MASEFHETDFPKAVPLHVQQREYAKEGQILKFTLKHPDREGTFELGSYVVREEGFLWHAMCVSTMAGCPIGCKFCATSYSCTPFERMLSSEEIEQQIRLAITERKKDGSPVPERTIVGYEGNGEPLLNLPAVVSATERLLVDPNIPIEAYTISTTGVKPQLIFDLADTPFGTSRKGKLQFSLISMNPAVRRDMIPSAKTLEECVPNLDAFATKTGHGVKYNIPLMQGVNDSEEEAHLFASFILESPHLRRARVATFNPFLGSELRPTDHDRFDRFVRILKQHGVTVIVFSGVTDDKVMAGCGQLRARTLSTMLSEPKPPAQA
jgi:23S rRNA (adenine2503-C2)-methyltransferase